MMHQPMVSLTNMILHLIIWIYQKQKNQKMMHLPGVFSMNSIQHLVSWIYQKHKKKGILLLWILQKGNAHAVQI